MREGPTGNIPSGKHGLCPQKTFPLQAGPDSFLHTQCRSRPRIPTPKALRAVPTSTHYLERESYVDGNRASDRAQA